jgi:flagellar motor switch protein FliM
MNAERELTMNENYGIIDNEFARKIVHEYNVFMKETREKIDETRKATMISLKKLLKLKDGDVISVQEDDTIKIIPAEEILNGRR